MNPIYICLIVLGVLALLFFLTCYICFRIAFYVPEKKKIRTGYDLPSGKGYKQYYPDMIKWIDQTRAYKYQKFTVKSFDGLELVGNYYEFFKGAPVEIMFHGYRGSAERDLSGGIIRCIELRRNAITVDMRAHGRSGGNVITFGIKERYDVQAWANLAYEKFGKDVKLILTGISMGASTVIMASSLPLPPTVVGIVADCGYNDAKQIIKRVIKQIGLPAWLIYPFVKCGAIIFGGFNPDQTSPRKEAQKSSLPIFFVHGDADDFVPYQMSEDNFNNCSSPKRLEIIAGAGHGLCFPLNPDKYIGFLRDFESKHYPQTKIEA